MLPRLLMATLNYYNNDIKALLTSHKASKNANKDIKLQHEGLSEQFAFDVD